MDPTRRNDRDDQPRHCSDQGGQIASKTENEVIPGTDTPGIGAKPGDELRFELAIGQLEQIIEEIESGQIGLEQSLSAYERGMKLIVRCRSILDTAEKRIAELTVEPDGTLRAQVDDEDETGQAAENI